MGTRNDVKQIGSYNKHWKNLISRSNKQRKETFWLIPKYKVVSPYDVVDNLSSCAESDKLILTQFIFNIISALEKLLKKQFRVRYWTIIPMILATFFFLSS
jgi:hypothetical protein